MDFSKLVSGLKCSMVELTALFLGHDEERQQTPPRKPQRTGAPVLAKSISLELGSPSCSPPALFSAPPHEVQDLHTLCILPNTPIYALLVHMLLVTFLYPHAQANYKAPKPRMVVAARTPRASTIRECIPRWQPGRTPRDCLKERAERSAPTSGRIQKSRGLNIAPHEKRSEKSKEVERHMALPRHSVPTLSPVDCSRMEQNSLDGKKQRHSRGGLDGHALNTSLPQSPFPESDSGERAPEITSLRNFSVPKDPLLPLFRMIGLTPRFSAAFSEQIHSDLDVSAWGAGRRKIVHKI
jgi:hypothetical protein